MISNLLSFNEVEEITNYIENRNENSLYKFISTKGNILSFFNIVKNTLYNQNNTVSFKIKNENFNGDIVFDHHQFLINLPEDKNFTFNLHNLNFNLGYPTTFNISNTKNLYSCIKKINNTNFSIDNIKDLEYILEHLPVEVYNKLFVFIDNKILSNLNQIKIFDTKRDIDKIFTYNNENVLRILFFVCRQSSKYLKQLKLVLMKESNFSFNDFDKITVEQSVEYYKIIKELTNDRQQ